MARRIEIELTSTREDGTWTWRAAGAREPKGTVEEKLLPEGTKVGDVVRAELEGFIDGLRVASVLPPKPTRSDPERLELLTPASEGPLVTTTGLSRAGRGGRDKGPRRGRDRDRDRRDAPRGQRPGRDKAARSRPDRERGERGERGPSDRGGGRRGGPSEEPKPKPKRKRLKAGRAHRNELLESLKAEERPIAEQILQGGIPAVRQAISKQNEELRKEKKPEVNADALLQVAERLRPRALAANWRDRADAALRHVDDLDLRDLRSVVNAAGDAGRDQESRDVADQLRTALAERLEKEHAAWIAEVAENIAEERVVRALRLSSRPPKAGSPLPADLTQQLVAATSAALTADTGSQRWATVLDALAYSPIRRRVVPESLPEKLSRDLRDTIARMADRLPEIAHIFAVSSEDARPKPRPARRRGQGGPGRAKGQRSKAKPDPKGEGEGKGKPDERKAEAERKPEAEESPAANEAAETNGQSKGNDEKVKDAVGS